MVWGIAAAAISLRLLNLRFSENTPVVDYPLHDARCLGGELLD